MLILLATKGYTISSTSQLSLRVLRRYKVIGKVVRKTLAGCAVLAGLGGLLSAGQVAAAPVAKADVTIIIVVEQGGYVQNLHDSCRYWYNDVRLTNWNRGCAYPGGHGYRDFDPGYFMAGAHWRSDWDIFWPGQYHPRPQFHSDIRYASNYGGYGNYGGYPPPVNTPPGVDPFGGCYDYCY